MNKILQYKIERNLSYQELADRCGIDKGSLQRYASGEKPIKNMTLETAARICKGMGIENPLELLENYQE